MQKAVYIFGSGGHTRSLISLLKQCDFKILGIFDNTFNTQEKELINNIELIGSFKDYKLDKKIILSIGDNVKRRELFNVYSESLFMPNVFHPTNFVEDTVVLGKANFVFANAVLNSNVKIGDNNIINTGAIIEHEVEIGSHNHISVGSIICGRSKIGSNCFIGAGSVINDKVEVCDNVTIGSNSTVINSILEPGTYVGQPIRKVN